MTSNSGGFAFDNFLGSAPLNDMRSDIDELSDKALFIDGTKSMAGTLGMSGNLIVGFSAAEGLEQAIGILPATGHVSIYAKTDKMLYIQDDTGLETNITGGGSGLIGVTDSVSTLLGDSAGTSITTATGSTIVGLNAGTAITTSSENTLFGQGTGKVLSGGVSNFFAGYQSGLNIITGSNNLILGHKAGLAMVGVESNNIILKSPGVIGDSQTTRIGDTQTSCFISGIHSVTPSGATQRVIIDSSGELGSDSVGGLIGVTDSDNVLLGVNAGTGLTSGVSNVILGNDAGTFATTMGEAVIIGKNAASLALNQGRGIFIGANCGLNADVTSGTVAMGFNALQNITAPSTGNTVAVGFECMQMNTTGGGNTAVGALALKQNISGVLNTCMGRFTGTNILTDDSNCLIGAGSGGSIGLGVLGTGVGNSNTGCGTNTLFILGGSVAGDDFNTALGRSAGAGFTTGSSNLFLGHLAGSAQGDVAGESDNILIANIGVSAENATTRIGTFATITDCYIAGISGTPSGTPVACIQDPLTGQIGAGQVQMSGSGDMSEINSMDINGSGQILLQTSQVAIDAIKLNATAGGLEMDATGLINLTSTNANTQALKLVASNAVGGLLISANTGGIETTTSGAIDLQASVNMAGEGIKIRATGILGTIELDSGSGGVRVIDGGTGFFMEDTSSLFAIQFAIPVMAADYKLTYPAAQASSAGQALVNDSSGNLTWDNPVAAFPNGWINGLGMNNGTTTDTDKDIVPGECRSDDDTFNIVVSSTLTVDNTVSGINGLDTGSVSADTWYTIWVIADTTGSNAVAGLMSLSEFTPTLPGTHDVQRRVGWARTDSTSDFYKAFYGQSGFARVALWDVSETLLEVLTDGSATVYTIVDCSEFIPPVTGGLAGYTNMNHFGSDPQDFVTLAPTNLVPDLVGLSPVSNPRANRCFGGSNSTGGQTGSTFSFITFSDDQGEILYGNSSSTEDSDIWIIGYVDDVSSV